jgi:hypothetical protein
MAAAQDKAPLPVTIDEVAVSVSSNQALADAIAAQIKSSGVRGYSIDIACKDGKVELTGSLADMTQNERVIRAVLSVPGVRGLTYNLSAAEARPISPAQALVSADPAVLPPPMGSAVVDPLPIGHPGVPMPYDLNPPKMPPYAWPTYAPYNNFSRVAYPDSYPYNAWPYIGPFYPYPKVPLGWRSVTLEWQDGHWFLGRNGNMHDYWRVRYW